VKKGILKNIYIYMGCCNIALLFSYSFVRMYMSEFYNSFKGTLG
jgi:hypothetical protein